ncbi:MAG: hypothetical protein QOF62_2909 [Pyrinomonadaceae bacterium]|jgi:hypothetical protein|nr:hypothetical protein [Pyrinomonadaceae bacterium]
MAEIIVELPEDRTGAGSIRLVNGQGIDVAGPFLAFGRADRETAKQRGNAGASRLKPYGDTPYGIFAIVDMVKTGSDSNLATDSYGSHGAIRLKPIEGEAAVAEQSGRTGFMIHGGSPDAAGNLRPTCGSLRLSNKDMGLLLEAIALLTITELPPTFCRIEKTHKPLATVTAIDEGYYEPDPPSGMSEGWHLEAILVSRPDRLKLFNEGLESTGYSMQEKGGHDREANHDRDSHDRDVHDRDVNREPAGHDREAAHDRESGHDRDL